MYFPIGKLLLSIGLVSIFSPEHGTNLAAEAVQAVPVPFHVFQGGSDANNQIKLVVQGNEYFNYFSDELGYPVVAQPVVTASITLEAHARHQHEPDFNFVYGVFDKTTRALYPTSLRVGEVDPRQVPSLSSHVEASSKVLHDDQQHQPTAATPVSKGTFHMYSILLLLIVVTYDVCFPEIRRISL
jgi:hypothetical protein